MTRPNETRFCVWASVGTGLQPRTGAAWISLNITNLADVALQKTISFVFVVQLLCSSSFFSFSLVKGTSEGLCDDLTKMS